MRKFFAGENGVRGKSHPSMKLLRFNINGFIDSTLIIDFKIVLSTRGQADVSLNYYKVDKLDMNVWSTTKFNYKCSYIIYVKNALPIYWETGH